MTNIEFHGPPVYGERGPFWSAYLSVSGESEPTEVLVKLTNRPDEAFSRKMGNSYGEAARETIMRAFAEEKIREALSAGHSPPQVLTISVADDVELHLRRWGLLK